MRRSPYSSCLAVCLFCCSFCFISLCVCLQRLCACSISREKEEERERQGNPQIVAQTKHQQQQTAGGRWRKGGGTCTNQRVAKSRFKLAKSSALPKCVNKIAKKKKIGWKQLKETAGCPFQILPSLCSFPHFLHDLMLRPSSWAVRNYNVIEQREQKNVEREEEEAPAQGLDSFWSRKAIPNPERESQKYHKGDFQPFGACGEQFSWATTDCFHTGSLSYCKRYPSVRSQHCKDLVWYGW